jgi:hypothetical protein
MIFQSLFIWDLYIFRFREISSRLCWIALSVNYMTCSFLISLSFLSFDISQFRFIAESSIALYHKWHTSRIALWQISRMLKSEYVINASRSNKLSKIISIVETIIVINVRVDKNERKKCFARLSYEHEISSIIILRVLKCNEFRSCKSIMKLDLNAIMMKTRLQFCLRHKNWIIDD